MLLLCCFSPPLSFTNHGVLQAQVWELEAGFAYADLGKKKKLNYLVLLHIICHSVVSLIHQQTFFFFSELPFAAEIL